MLECAAEQTTKIATELINCEILPTETNQERGVQNLEFVLQRLWLARVKRRTTLLPTRGRIHRNDMILPLEEGRGIFFAQSFLRDVVLFWNSKRELNAGSPMSRYEKKLKGKMDDEIKLAGLEALSREELEKHLILKCFNSKRLRTF